MTCAIWQPVTNANDECAGSPRSSITQRPASASSAHVAGVGSASPVFWSQVDTSQSAAIDAGSAPPMTKPKNRPEPIAVIPGSSDAASSSITSLASDGPSGTGASSAAVHLAVRPLRGDAARVERLEVVGRDLRRAGEKLALGHDAESTSGSRGGAPAR